MDRRGSINPRALMKAQQLGENGSESVRTEFPSCSPVHLHTSERSFLGGNDNSSASTAVFVCMRVHACMRTCACACAQPACWQLQ